MAGGVLSVKEGQQKIFDEMARKYYQPVFEKLLAEGAINMYSVEVEDLHTAPPDRVIYIYTSATAEGLEKAQNALDSTFAGDPEAGAKFRQTVDWSRHFDFMTNVTEMVNK